MYMYMLIYLGHTEFGHKEDTTIIFIIFLKVYNYSYVHITCVCMNVYNIIILYGYMSIILCICALCRWKWVFTGGGRCCDELHLYFATKIQ